MTGPKAWPSTPPTGSEVRHIADLCFRELAWLPMQSAGKGPIVWLGPVLIYRLWDHRDDGFVVAYKLPGYEKGVERTAIRIPRNAAMHGARLVEKPPPVRRMRVVNPRQSSPSESALRALQVVR